MRFAGLALVAFATTAMASDHANLDAGRPLRFTDAYSAAEGAREFQFGLSGSSFSRVGVPVELKYGYASNRDIAIGFNPVLGQSSTLNSIHLSHFQTLVGETEAGPAFGLRLAADIPFDSDSPFGMDVTGIWSRYRGKGFWSHINLGYESQGSVVTGIAGLSHRAGLNQTLLGEIGMSSNQKWVGVGLRRQIGLSSVLDLGLEFALGSSQRTLRVGLTQSY